MRCRLLLILPILAPALAAAPRATVTVRNPIDVARPSETIVLDAAALRSLLAVDDVRKIHVRAEGSDKDLLVQAVDTNDDGVFEQFLFQADFAPRQTRVFLLTPGDKQIPRVEDYKTYGRFVRERRDDFAWENDRIAHRMYGKELETWPQEPLISSAVDVWTKRVRKLVVNDWYTMDDYHSDHGEGADFYAAGNTRGCGGTGIWGAKLYPSANFRDSRVFAVGPIRLLFELTYETWNAGGALVSEKKRISLDAGHSLGRFESRYTFEYRFAIDGGDASPLLHAVGIRKLKTTRMKLDRERGILRTWEPVHEGGELGQALLLDPASLKDTAEDDHNYFMLAEIAPGAACVSYAGFAWTLGPDFRTVEDWDRYLADESARLRAPVEISIDKR